MHRPVSRGPERIRRRGLPRPRAWTRRRRRRSHRRHRRAASRERAPPPSIGRRQRNEPLARGDRIGRIAVDRRADRQRRRALLVGQVGDVERDLRLAQREDVVGQPRGDAQRRQEEGRHPDVVAERREPAADIVADQLRLERANRQRRDGLVQPFRHSGQLLAAGRDDAADDQIAADAGAGRRADAGGGRGIVALVFGQIVRRRIIQRKGPSRAQREGGIDAVGLHVAHVDQDRGAAGDAAAGDAAGVGRDREQAVVEVDMVVIDLRIQPEAVRKGAVGAQAGLVGPAALRLALGSEGIERRLAAGEPRPATAGQIGLVLPQVLLDVGVDLLMTVEVVSRADRRQEPAARVDPPLRQATGQAGKRACTGLHRKTGRPPIARWS